MSETPENREARIAAMREAAKILGNISTEGIDHPTVHVYYKAYVLLTDYLEAIDGES